MADVDLDVLDAALGDNRLGQRFSLSRSVTSKHIVIGSSNFRSPIVPTSEQRRIGRDRFC